MSKNKHLKYLFSILKGEHQGKVEINKKIKDEFALSVQYLLDRTEYMDVDIDDNTFTERRVNPHKTESSRYLSQHHHIKKSDYASYIERKTNIKNEFCFLKPSLPYYGNKFKLLKYLDAVMPIDYNNFYDLFAGGGTVFSNIWALSNKKQKLKTITDVTVNEILQPIALMHEFFFTEHTDIIISMVSEIQNALLEGIRAIDKSFDYLDASKKTERLRQDRYREPRKNDYNLLLMTLSEAVSRLNELASSKKQTNSSDHITEVLALKAFIGAAYYVAFKNTLKGHLVISRASVFKGTADYVSHISYKDIADLRAYCLKIKEYANQLAGRYCFLSESYDYISPESLKQNDLVYLDPPYLITSATYNAGWRDQDDEKLYDYIDRLTKVGVKCMLSNALVHQRLEREDGVVTRQDEYNSILLKWLEKDLKSGANRYTTFVFEKIYTAGVSKDSHKRAYEIITVNYNDWQCDLSITTDILGVEVLTLHKINEIKEKMLPASPRI